MGIIDNIRAAVRRSRLLLELATAVAKPASTLPEQRPAG